MTRRRLEWDEITPEVVRAWGYDDDLVLMEQDEELLLYHVELIPALLELAGDERCPKRDLAFFILCQLAREQVTRGGARGTDALRAAWSSIPEPVGDRPGAWGGYVARLLAYTQPSGSLNKQAARGIAEDLLLGIAGRLGVVIEGNPVRVGWWRFTLQTSVTEHVDVCQSTGEFAYTPWH